MFSVCLYYLFTDDLYKQYMIQLKKYTHKYYVCTIIIYHIHTYIVYILYYTQIYNICIYCEYA